MALATSDIPTVSIVSLLADRRQFIPLLRKCVELQTYPKEKIEWVIVDDGQDIPPETFDKSHEIYVQLNKKLPLGRKRQLACDLASGEFIFFFDDDVGSTNGSGIDFYLRRPLGSPRIPAI